MLEPWLSHCELHPEAMQIWDGGVSGAALDMPSPAIPLQKEVISPEDKIKIKQAVVSRGEDARAGTSPWSQEIFITILTHQTDLDHKEVVGVVHT